MKVYLDTNILIDLLDSTRENNGAAACIYQIVKDRLLQATVSALTIADCAYILRKVDYQVMKSTLSELSTTLDIASIDGSHIQKALNNPCQDFEDAVQIACAEESYCDLIITDNIRHFEGFTSLPVYNPVDFLRELYR